MTIKRIHIINIAVIIVLFFALMVKVYYLSYYLAQYPTMVKKVVIARAFEEKYGEKFKVVSLDGSSSISGSLKSGPNWIGDAYGYPESDPNIWVQAWVSVPTKRSLNNKATIIHDDYITSLLKRDLQNDLNAELGKYFDLFVAEPVKYHSMGIFHDNGIHSAAEATPENISAAMQQEREDSKAAENSFYGSWNVPDYDVSVDIVLPESALESEEQIRSAVLETAKHFDPLKIDFSCWFTNEETLNKCLEIVQKRDRKRLDVFGEVINYPNEPMRSVYLYTPDGGLEYTPAEKYR